MPRLVALVLLAAALAGCGTSADPMAGGTESPAPVITVPRDTPEQSPSEFVEPTRPSSSPSSTRSSPATSPAAPVLNTGDAAKLSGMRVSPSTLRNMDDGRTCSEVLYVNEGGAAARVSPFDWRLQLPSGAVLPPLLSSDSFLADEVPVNGTLSGTLCFRAEVADEGLYRLLYLAPLPSVETAVFAEQRS